MSTTIGVKLDPELKTRIQSLADARERTPHWIIKAAIAEYLEREERYQRELAEDQAEWDDFVLTGKALTHDEVRAHFEQKIKERKQRGNQVAGKGAARSRSSARLPRRKGH
jgi:predicted transcriptional regulator